MFKIFCCDDCDYPDDGLLACGASGEGRFPDTECIMNKILTLFFVSVRNVSGVMNFCAESVIITRTSFSFDKVLASMQGCS